jgi:hypothetical protein
MATTYSKMVVLIRSCIVNADKELLINNQHNSAWIMEYLSIFFARKGYEMYRSEWTVLRLYKKHLVYYYELLPALHDIQEKENWTLKDIALKMGYKNANTLNNSINIRHTNGFIKGYYSRERTA